MATDASPRERLVTAAAELFHRHGYGSVGVSDLCDAADVRRGSFYYFFDSKEALAAAAVDHLRQSTEREVLQLAFAPDVSPAQRIERYFETLADGNERWREQLGYALGCPFGNLSIEAADDHQLIRAAVLRAFDTLRQYFRSCLADAASDGADVDPDAGADLLLAFMEGAVLVARADGDPATIRRLARAAPRLVGIT